MSLVPYQQVHANPYNPAQIEVDGLNDGTQQGDVAWGDFDNDGNLDILTCGRRSTPANSNNGQIRVYRNLGGPAYNFSPRIDVPAFDAGVRNCSVEWGDYNNDGFLDILVSGRDTGTTNLAQLRVYINNGAGGFNPAPVEVDGAGGGLRNGSATFGDFDNDGDLDILASGQDQAGAQQLRVYRNNGDGTYDPNQIEVDGAGGGLNIQGDVAWGDFDGDNDLDILACGGNAGRQLRVYRNNGNGTFDNNQIEVESAGNGLDQCGVAWGDYDNDNDLDIIVMGRTSGVNNNSQLRIYPNNGNGTFSAVQVEVDGINGGLRNAKVAVGDTDNDGDMDILVAGRINGGNNRQLRVHLNNGAPGYTWSPAQVEVDGLDGGLSEGGVAWGDYDNDGDIDILVNGRTTAGGTNRQLRIYINNAVQANTVPAAPTTLISTFTFSNTNTSTATFKWNPGVDGGVGFTPTSQLNYDVRISTIAGVGLNLVYPGKLRTSPASGAYHRPPQIYDGNTNHGVILTSTDPWNPQPAQYGLRTDTTYYYNVRTIDMANTYSGLSAAQTLWTGVAPSTSTIAASGGPAAGQITLNWNSAGDDENQGALTGVYRYQYSTNGATVWNRDITPPGATTVDIATTTQLAGSAQAELLTGLTIGFTYHFVLWTQDDVGLWSPISNQTSAVVPAAPPPGGIADLTVVAATTDGQIVLTWTSPANITADTNPGYDVRWADTDITNDAQFTAATPLTTNVPVPTGPGLGETMFVNNVAPEQTVYFAVKGFHDSATGPLSNSDNGTPLAFDRTQMEVRGAANIGLNNGDITWGDLDGDGLWDIVVQGQDNGGTSRLWAFLNLGGGSFNTTPVVINATGLFDGNVDLGDFDGDGKLDVAANGDDGTGNRQLRVYINNSTLGSISFSTVIEVPGAANQGFDFRCGLQWGDFNNDGDLDLVVCGDEQTSGNAHLYVYLNQGGSFSPTPVDVSGTDMYRWGDLTIADFNNDNLMDVAAQGYNTAQTARRLAIYTNQGGTPPTFVETILAPVAPNALSSGDIDAGDQNNDGLVDILAQGFSGGGNRQMWVWQNTTAPAGSPPTFNAPVAVEGANIGLNRGETAWGDYNNDGNLDALGQGGTAGGAGPANGFIRLYANTGAFTFGARIDVENPNDGLRNEGSVKWGDYDQDGDSDLLVSGEDNAGNPQIRVYINYYSVSTIVPPNNPPAAPTVLDSSFSFDSLATSTATFNWEPAVDDITPTAGLRYQVQAATTTPLYSYNPPLAINTPAPQYFPLTYDCGSGPNTCHGTVLVSTNPWDPQSGTLTGLVTDTTYYFHVKTIDSGDLESGWSANDTLWTGVAPTTSTISAASSAPNLVTLSWASAGDDQNRGILNGNYRIQYSTESTTPWSLITTPPGAFTVTVATTGVTAGSVQNHTLPPLLDATTYYFVLWSEDDVGLWSTISNMTSTMTAVAIRSITITETEYQFGTLNVALTTNTTSAISVGYAGNTNTTFTLIAATVTAGSPWSIAAAAGADNIAVYAGHHGTQPVPAQYGAEDIILNAVQACTATRYTIDGTESCLNVTPGTNMSLWFRIDMPTSSSTIAEQRIRITVEAGPP